MLPVVSVVGNSDSGKTRVAESLVQSLTGQGYRIAAIKHCPHGHDLGRPGSDTDRLRNAGGVTVIASSPGLQTRIDKVDGDASLEHLVSTIGGGIDMVVAEGFKTSAVPKVLVLDGAPPASFLQSVVATVGESDAIRGVPGYTFRDLDGLAAQLREQFLEPAGEGESVSVTVDGEAISLLSWPANLLAGIVRAFLASLRDIPEDPSEIRITIQRRSGRR